MIGRTPIREELEEHLRECNEVIKADQKDYISYRLENLSNENLKIFIDLLKKEVNQRLCNIQK